MCGINGIYKKSKSLDFNNILFNMNKCIKHRGPDYQSVYINKKIGFGFGATRLSIIDLENRSNQPYQSKNNSNVIVFNGEIYNYVEIKNILKSKGIKFYTEGDTEVLLEGYNYFGKNILDYIEGMFAFVIWDKKKKIFFCARDHLGIKPFIYSLSKSSFVFSSEIKPISENFLELKNINLSSVINILNYGSINQPNTIYKDLNYLKPAHYMEVDEKFNFKVEQYWDINKFLDQDKVFENEQDYITETSNLLYEKFKKQLISDVPISNLLSGGLDSSIILGISSTSSLKIKNYNLYFDNEEEYDEREDADNVAKKLNQEILKKSYSENEIVSKIDEYIEIIDQPSFDGFNSYLVLNCAKNKTKICLSGLGADEIFFGYGIHLDYIQSKRIKKNSISKVLSLVHKLRPNNITLKQYLSELSEEDYFYVLRKLTKCENKKIYKKKYLNEAELNKKQMLNLYDNNHIDLRKRIFHFEIKNYLNNTLLRDNDIVSMANSIELRPLFLNHKIVEWAAMTIKSLKFTYDDSKKPLRSIYKKIYNSKYKNLKKGFELPHHKWVTSKSIKEKILNYLDKEKIYSKYYKNLLIRNISDRKYSKEIFNYYLLKKWLEKENIKI